MKPHEETRAKGADDGTAVWAEIVRSRYDVIASEPLPDRVRDLLKQLDAAEARER